MIGVIPAAGLGTRLLPATKAQPKEMLPVVDRPAIQYVVEEAAASGLDEVYIVVGPTKRSIREHFSKRLPAAMARRAPDALRKTMALLDQVRVRFLVQKEPRGLGHAVLQARRVVRGEPFAVLLGDDLLFDRTPCTRQLVRAHEWAGGSVIAVERKPQAELSRYGVVDLAPRRGPLWPVRRLVEKPDPKQAPSRYAVVGRYLLEPRIFDLLRKTPPGRNGEIQLTDALDRLAREGRVSAHLWRGRRLDVGTTTDWILANVEVGLRDPRFRGPIRAGLARRRSEA